MSTTDPKKETRLRRLLFGAITIGPILFALLSTVLLYQDHLPSSDFKWILGLCFVFSLLGFAVDRLISFKGFGVEARLAELDNATQKAYASVEEMNQMQQQIRSLAEHLAAQQALIVMQNNRFVGDDYLSDRVRKIGELQILLESVNATKDGIETMLNSASPYIRIDLNYDVFRAVSEAFQLSNNENTQEIRQNWQKFRQDFYSQFIISYEVGITPNKVFEFLKENEVDITKAIQTAFSRLDAFLGEGRYLDINCNFILSFPNPQASNKNVHI